MKAGPNVVQDGLKVQVDFGSKKTFDPVPTTRPLALNSSTNIINTAPSTGNVLGNASPQSPFTYYSLYDPAIGGNIDGEANADVYHKSLDSAIVTSTYANGTTANTNFGSRKITAVATGTSGVNAFADGWQSMIIGDVYYLEHTSTNQYSGFFKYVGRDPVTYNPGGIYTLQGQMITSETNIILNTPNNTALRLGDIIEVGAEYMRVEFWLNAFGSGDTWRVTRAVNGTATENHAAGDTAFVIEQTYLYKHYFEWVASHNEDQRAQRALFSPLPVNNSVNIYPAEKVSKWGYEGHCIANEYNWSAGNPSDGWVNINHNQGYDVAADPFTIEVWFRMRDLPTADYGHGTPIYGDAQGNNYAMFCYPPVGFGQKCNIGVCLDDSRYSTSHRSTKLISQMEWVQFVHLHTPFNGIQGQFEYYVNGELDTTLTTSADANGFSVPNTLTIGRDSRWLVNSRIDMAIIRHYDRKLTADEIKQNFNANRGRFGI